MSVGDKEGNEPGDGAASSSGVPSLAESWQAVAEKAGVDPLIGTLIGGRYRIQGILGKGGMSIVYQGSQAPVDRIVALKTLKFQMMGDPILVKRFEREVRTLSKLNHPNIVTVFDCVLDDRGQPYFVMDCLAGHSLQEILSTEVLLDPLRAQHIFIQCCSAVEHAHRHGIIHRDLKPGNIMILDGSGHDFVKVVDFGLARLAEDAQRLTQSGEIWGSPLYMSPEQSSAEELDARSDIYSLGTVMYEALTGSPPFRGKTFLDTMTMQVNMPPPFFKDVAPAAVVPQAFEQVVRKCLVKDPDGRYQTMAEVKEALKNVIPGHPYDAMIAGSSPGNSSIKLPTQAKARPAARPPVTGYNYQSKGLSARMFYGPALAILVIAASVLALRGVLWPSGRAIEAPKAVAPPAPSLVSPVVPALPARTTHKKIESPATKAAPHQERDSVVPPAAVLPKHADRLSNHAERQVAAAERAEAERAHHKRHTGAAVEAKTVAKLHATPAAHRAPVDEFAALRASESESYKRDKEQP